MKLIYHLRLLSFACIGLLLGSFPALAQRTATGEPVVYFGFVVTITVIDPGAGYVNPPTVSITGGGGTGALAEATITNGAVSHVTMLDAGSGYTNQPTVEFSPPPRSTTIGLRMVPMLTVESEPYSWVTIQWANALGDTNQWFTLTNMVLGSNSYLWFDTEAGAAGKRFYRAINLPQPTNPDRSQLVWIPPGSFLMGSPDTEQDRYPNEGPQTEVKLLAGFFMRKYEVTQGEYTALMGSNPSSPTGDTNLPVNQVNWYDATNFCVHLTASERAAGRLPAGWAYRLPTEAEWERACRTGSTNRFSFGDDLAYGLISQYAWYDSSSGNTAHPVGSKLPNAWGLYDMAGNLREWCLDWLGNYPGGSRIDQPGSVWGVTHAVRGGCFAYGASAIRCAFREEAPPEYSLWNLGFRPVLAPGP